MIITDTSEPFNNAVMAIPHETQDYKQYEVKEGIVFLIELTDSIFKPLKELEDRCQLQEILTCVNELMSDMVVTFPKNGIGIYFYNCSQTGSKFPKKSGINKIFSLNDLNSSNMKTLTNIVRDEFDGFKPLKSRFLALSEPLDNLQTVLRTILREFQYKPQYNRTKLLWFTANDKPYINPQAKDSLRTMISDFEDNKISIDPIFLDSYVDESQEEKSSFDLSLYEKIFLNTNFLSEMLKRLKEAETKNSEETLGFFNKIKDSIHRLREVRRMQFSCDLILSDGPDIGGALGCSIQGYTLFDHEKVKPSKQVYTEGEALKVVYLDSALVRSDTKTELENIKKEEEESSAKGDMRPNVVKGIPVKNTTAAAGAEASDKIILLSENILRQIKGYNFDHIPQIYKNSFSGDSQQFSEEFPIEEVLISKVPYLKLLCFRNLSTYQPFFNLKPALFVTADLKDGLGASNREGGYMNSRTTFTSLYQSCVKLQRYAMVFGCTKLNSTPTLYAMYPTNCRQCDRASSTKLPDGFLLINVPWFGELRSLPDYMLTDAERYFFMDVSKTAPIELISAYKKIINTLGTTNYDPYEHNNPVLQFFYKVIKQEVLQIDIKNEDQTIEGNDWSVQQLIELSDQFKSDANLHEITLFMNSILNSIGNAEFLKRTAEEHNSTAKRQKPRALNEADVKTLWKYDTWSNVTVAQLREFIKRYDSIPTASKKADMVTNIIQFLESRKRDPAA